MASYIYNTVFKQNGVSIEADEIHYSTKGIEKWLIWSVELQDYMELSLGQVEAAWPGKFADLEEKLVQMAHENERHEEADRLTDQALGK